MKKDFGAKPFLFPQPVMIIGTYDENGKANAMNAFLYWRNAQAYAQGDYRLWSKDSFRAEMAAEHARLAAIFG